MRMFVSLLKQKATRLMVAGGGLIVAMMMGVVAGQSTASAMNPFYQGTEHARSFTNDRAAHRAWGGASPGEPGTAAIYPYDRIHIEQEEDNGEL